MAPLALVANLANRWHNLVWFKICPKPTYKYRVCLDTCKCMIHPYTHSTIIMGPFSREHCPKYTQQVKMLEHTALTANA